MKLIFTVNTYKPNLDGVQFVTSYLAEGLAKKGHDVYLITKSFNRIETPTEETICGVKVIRKAIRTSHTFHLGNKKEYQEFIIKMCSDADCLINVGSQSPFTDWCFEIFDRIKIPKVLYLHSIWDFKYHKENFYNLRAFLFKTWANIRWGIYYKKNKKKFKSYDSIIQLHKKDYSYLYFLKKYGIVSNIIENAAENVFFEKHIEKDFKKPFNNYIINVANFIDRKNQIAAVKEFLKSSIDDKIGLVLIGSSKNKYYEKLVKFEEKERIKLNIDKKRKPILILTNIERKYISSYVSNADIYLMTSKDEKYPISIVESMAAGIPFISTDVGIVRYLPGGVVSSYEDIHYWIEELYSDANLRTNLGNLGIYYAKSHMRIDDKISQLESIIKELKGEKNERL